MATTVQKNTATKKAAPPPPAPKATAKSPAQKAADTRKANVAKAATPAPAPAAKAKAKAAPAPVETEVVSMGRKDLASAIRDKLREQGKGVPQDIAEMAVGAFEQVVADTLASGGVINLPGFGKFVTKAVDEREGRNPKTGEALTIAATTKITFKVGSKLKAAVNGEAEGEAEEGEGEGDE